VPYFESNILTGFEFGITRANLLQHSLVYQGLIKTLKKIPRKCLHLKYIRFRDNSNWDTRPQVFPKMYAELTIKGEKVLAGIC
jgi:hypothetical protein